MTLNIVEFGKFRTASVKSGANGNGFAGQVAKHMIAKDPEIMEPGEKLLTRFVNQMCASSTGVPAESLINPARGSAHVSRARQMAMYLLHTSLSFSLNEIAAIFGKDRTTIGHACRVVEDLRDDHNFDRQMSDFEEILKTAVALTQCKSVEPAADA